MSVANSSSASGALPAPLLATGGGAGAAGMSGDPSNPHPAAGAGSGNTCSGGGANAAPVVLVYGLQRKLLQRAPAFEPVVVADPRNPAGTGKAPLASSMPAAAAHVGHASLGSWPSMSALPDEQLAFPTHHHAQQGSADGGALQLPAPLISNNQRLPTSGASVGSSLAASPLPGTQMPTLMMSDASLAGPSPACPMQPPAGMAMGSVSMTMPMLPNALHPPPTTSPTTAAAAAGGARAQQQQQQQQSAAPPTASALGRRARPGERAVSVAEGTGVAGVDQAALALLLGERQFLGTFALRLPSATVLGHPVVLNRDAHHDLLCDGADPDPTPARRPPAQPAQPELLSASQSTTAAPPQARPSPNVAGGPAPAPTTMTGQGGGRGGSATPLPPPSTDDPAVPQKRKSERAASAFVIVVVPDACTASRDVLATALAAFAMSLQHVEHCDGYVCSQIVQLQRTLAKGGDDATWATLLRTRGPRLAAEVERFAATIRTCVLPLRSSLAALSRHNQLLPSRPVFAYAGKPLLIAGVVGLDLNHVVARSRALRADPDSTTYTLPPAAAATGPQPQLPLVPPIAVCLSPAIVASLKHPQQLRTGPSGPTTATHSPKHGGTGSMPPRSRSMGGGGGSVSALASAADMSMQAQASSASGDAPHPGGDAGSGAGSAPVSPQHNGSSQPPPPPPRSLFGATKAKDALSQALAGYDVSVACRLGGGGDAGLTSPPGLNNNDSLGQAPSGMSAARATMVAAAAAITQRFLDPLGGSISSLPSKQAAGPSTTTADQQQQQQPASLLLAADPNVRFASVRLSELISADTALRIAAEKASAQLDAAATIAVHSLQESGLGDAGGSSYSPHHGGLQQSSHVRRSSTSPTTAMPPPPLLGKPPLARGGGGSTANLTKRGSAATTPTGASAAGHARGFPSFNSLADVTTGYAEASFGGGGGGLPPSSSAVALSHARLGLDQLVAAVEAHITRELVQGDAAATFFGGSPMHSHENHHQQQQQHPPSAAAAGAAASATSHVSVSSATESFASSFNSAAPPGGRGGPEAANGVPGRRSPSPTTTTTETPVPSLQTSLAGPSAQGCSVAGTREAARAVVLIMVDLGILVAASRTCIVFAPRPSKYPSSLRFARAAAVAASESASASASAPPSTGRSAPPACPFGNPMACGCADALATPISLAAERPSTRRTSVSGTNAKAPSTDGGPAAAAVLPWRAVVESAMGLHADPDALVRSRQLVSFSSNGAWHGCEGGWPYVAASADVTAAASTAAAMQRSASYATAMGFPSVASFGGGGGGDGRGRMSAFASRMHMSHSGPDMMTGAPPGSPATGFGSVAGIVAGGRLRRSRAASATDNLLTTGAAHSRRGGSDSNLATTGAGGGAGGWGAVVGLPSHTTAAAAAASSTDQQPFGIADKRRMPGQRGSSAHQLSSVDDLASDDDEDGDDGGSAPPAFDDEDTMSPACTDATTASDEAGVPPYSSPTSVMVRAAGLLDAVVAEVSSTVVAQWWGDHGDDVVAAFEASVGVNHHSSTSSHSNSVTKDGGAGATDEQDHHNLRQRAVGHMLACLLLRLLDRCASPSSTARRQAANGAYHAQQQQQQHRKTGGHSLELHSAVSLLSETLAEFAFGAFGLPGMTRTPSTKEASLVLHHMLRVAGPEVRVVQRPHAPTSAEVLGVGSGNLGAS